MLSHRGRGGDFLRLVIPSTLLLLLCVGATQARTWHVPAFAPTVQAGIDSAQAGDDVLLAAGTYTRTSENATGESMLEMKPGIRLHSESGAAATLLDVEYVGRVMRCADVGDQVVIEGENGTVFDYEETSRSVFKVAKPRPYCRDHVLGNKDVACDLPYFFCLVNGCYQGVCNKCKG